MKHIKKFEELEFVMERWCNKDDSHTIFTSMNSSEYIGVVYYNLSTYGDNYNKVPLEINCEFEEIIIKYYTSSFQEFILSREKLKEFHATKIIRLTPKTRKDFGYEDRADFQNNNGEIENISLRFLKNDNSVPKNSLDIIAKSIYETVSGYDFQKQYILFLLEKGFVNDIINLDFIGVNPKISEEYDYLWSGNDMGLL